MATPVEVVGASSITTTPGVTGTGTAAAAGRVVTASDSPEIALIGAVTETAPATDTASSGLNGRLQRIAQRLSTLITAIGTLAFGAGTATGALRTSLASDDPAVATLGAVADAAATQGSTGSISAKLRTATGQLNTLTTNLGIHAYGAGTASAAQRITFASDAPGVANATAGEFETVAASQTTQSMGATGAAGDYLEAVLIVPATVNPGNVLIRDGSGSDITIFTGGTASITDLAPIYVPLGIISLSGAWKVTTGTNVSAIGIGNFT